MQGHHSIPEARPACRAPSISRSSLTACARICNSPELQRRTNWLVCKTCARLPVIGSKLVLTQVLVLSWMARTVFGSAKSERCGEVMGAMVVPSGSRGYSNTFWGLL